MTLRKQSKPQSKPAPPRLGADAETLCALLARIVARIVTEPRNASQHIKA